jgi:predicted MFS family arabinose efflux permease
MAVYVLALMSSVAVLAAYDRFLIGILVQDIKADLHLSDGQIGLLTGLGFALVYSLLAVPVARISDRGHRVPVLAWSVLLWSAMTAICGLAASFPLLLLARIGVGVGEAGCIPTMQAILSDRFRGRWRATAITIVMVAGGAGTTIASLGGGWLADHWGWRSAFLVGAAPGPLLALLLWWTLQKRPSSVPAAVAPVATITTRRALSILWGVPSLRLLYVGYGLGAMSVYAGLAWVPAYLMRTYHLTAGEVGASYGTISGIAMIAGVLWGGVGADLLARRDQRWPVWQISLTLALAFPVTVGFFLVHDLRLALMLSAPMAFLSMATNGTNYALIQHLAGPRLRATGAALYLLISNLAGVGLGPSIIGWLSDGLAGHFGAGGLRFALLILSITYLVGASIVWLASRSIRHDIETAPDRGREPED